MQNERNGDTFRHRARLAAEAASAANEMGYREIAEAYRSIEQMWLKLARQNETLQK